MTIIEAEWKLREDMCEIARLMYAKGYIGGPAGNISARLGEDRFLLTPSIFFKQRLKPDQLIVIDGEGKKVEPHTEANKDLGPTSEVPMHLDTYRARPDVCGIVHGHLTHCVALTVAGKQIRSQVLTEAMLFLGKVGIAEYATPTTAELGQNVADKMQAHDAVVLPYHGAIVAGKDMWDAYAKMEVLEQTAEICCAVNQMGGEVPLECEHVENMLELRRNWKMDRPSDNQLLRLKTPQRKEH